MSRPEQALELDTDSLAPAALAELPDEALLEQVQRQTFRFFWEGAHPGSGLAPDGIPGAQPPPAGSGGRGRLGLRHHGA